MSGATRARRLDRVSAAREAATLGAEVRRVAAYLGVPVAEVRAEVEDVARLCRAAGAFTVDARVAVVARDLGMPADELRAEIARLRKAIDATA